MTDVRQWLAEIKLIQQKLAQVQQERDEAYASAANWRNLYETEAKQRRTESHLNRQTIESLQAQIQELQVLPGVAADRPEPATHLDLIQQEVERLQTVDQLRARLVQALLDCDRLTQALKGEQAAHTQTRKSLTTALGDTIDRLTQERLARPQDAESLPGTLPELTNYDVQGGDRAKTPLPELPMLD